MKYFFPIICLVFFNMANAQTAEDSVKASVAQLFTALKNADSAMFVESFSDSAILQTIVNTNAHQTEIRNDKVNDVAEAVSKLHKNDADERIRFEIVKIDGPLAIVWAPYKLYFKGKFSHCGVDSFQLICINGKWKIHYLIDTRRKNNCE